MSLEPLPDINIINLFVKGKVDDWKLESFTLLILLDLIDLLISFLFFDLIELKDKLSHDSAKSSE